MVGRYFEMLRESYWACLRCEQGHPWCYFGADMDDCGNCDHARLCPKTLCHRMHPEEERLKRLPDYESPGCPGDELDLLLNEPPVDDAGVLEEVPYKKSEIIDFASEFVHVPESHGKALCDQGIRMRKTVFAFIDYVLLRRRSDQPEGEKEHVPDFEKICKSLDWEYTAAEYLIPFDYEDDLFERRLAMMRGRSLGVGRRFSGSPKKITIDRALLRSYLKEGVDIDKLVDCMNSKEIWAITDLGRVAVLLSIGHWVKETDFLKWFPSFCQCMGRSDVPSSFAKSNYKFGSKSLEVVFWRKFSFLKEKIDNSDRVTYEIDNIFPKDM